MKDENDGLAVGSPFDCEPDKGPSSMMMKMRRGVGRLHVPTADYELIVVEGTMKHWRAGENEATVKPERTRTLLLRLPIALGSIGLHDSRRGVSTALTNHQARARVC